MPASGFAFSLYMSVFNSMQTSPTLVSSYIYIWSKEQHTEDQCERPCSVSEEDKDDGLFLVHFLDTFHECHQGQGEEERLENQRRNPVQLQRKRYISSLTTYQ